MAHQTSALVIFEHELLGEGIAARLQAMGIRTLTAKACDPDVIATALGTHPDVVVVECHNAGCLDRVRRLSPASRVVDATASVGRGYPTEALRFEVILDALQSDPPPTPPA